MLLELLRDLIKIKPSAEACCFPDFNIVLSRDGVLLLFDALKKSYK